jgi:sulfhydrogenase subunit alpha
MQESVLNHYICKIEGHGNLKLNYKSGKATLAIDEGERLFEQLVLNRPYEDAPFITARICGVCPTAHVLTAIMAIENAFDIKVNDRIKNLRRALEAGQIIQSHSLHLFFLASPDYLNVVNAIELHRKKPELYQAAVSLKKLGDKVVEVIGGRAIHPVAPAVGGFFSVPTNDQLKDLIKELEASMAMALEIAEMFAGFKYPTLKRKTEYLATQNEGKLTYVDGTEIISNQGLKSTIDNYSYAFREETRPDSPTKYGTRDGHGFMVGALARLSLDHENLNPKALYTLREIWGKELPTYNSFHNNVAQAIEIVHLIEEAANELRLAIENSGQLARVPFKVREGSGVAAVEAPRGTLYHAVKTDAKGIIKEYDIVTPTVQSLVNLEEDANELMKTHRDLPEKELFKEVEMLIRAYDPCITCSVH